MTDIELRRKLDAIKVLSYLPYCPCGATLVMLALDVFGKADGETVNYVRRLLDHIEHELGITVAKAILPTASGATGGPGWRRNHLHYWIADQQNQDFVLLLVTPLLDAEDQQPEEGAIA